MNVRELSSLDLATFKEIRPEALRTDPDAFGQTLESALLSSDEAWRARFTSTLETGVILVAEDDGRVLGMCATGPDAGDPSVAFLWGMFVRSDARGRGVGAALMRHAEEWAVARGLTEIRAKVAAPNQDAIRFYAAMGYEIGPIIGVLRPGSEISVHSILKRIG